MECCETPIGIRWQYFRDGNVYKKMRNKSEEFIKKLERIKNMGKKVM